MIARINADTDARMRLSKRVRIVCGDSAAHHSSR